MPDRASLELRARVVGVTPSNYVNDSQLEQRVIFQEKLASTVTGALSTGTLTNDATAPTDGDTVTVGGYTYTWVTTLADVAATNTLTSNNTNVSAADTVTVNGTVYTFRATTVTRPYEVLIGASADASLTNLANAINGSGTGFGLGTAAHPTVSSSAVASHVLTLSARTTGTAGNALTLATPAATLTAGAATFSGGRNVPSQVLIGDTTDGSASLANLKSAVNGTTGAGTTYSNGTPKNLDATAGTLTGTTLVFTATNASVNNAATTETSSHMSFGATTLTGGSPKVVAAPSGAAAAVSGGAQV